MPQALHADRGRADRLDEREPAAREPHALPGAEPHIAGRAFLGDPDAAGVAGNLEAAGVIQPHDLPGGKREGGVHSAHPR